MKVLVIPTWYPVGADKLMGIYHKEYTEALNKYGVQANMLYMDRQGIKNIFKYIFSKKKTIDKEYNYDAYLYKMFDASKLSYDHRVKKYVKCLDKAFADYLKTNDKPDLIHAEVTVPAGYAACKLGEKYGIPVVVTEHCGDLERFFTREDLKKYSDYVLKHSTYSVVSNYMKEIVLKYTDNCIVIPNIVNVDIFKNDIIRKKSVPFKLVSACALREGKRLDVAFEALRKVIDRGALNVRLDIIGDGYYEKALREKVKQLELEKNVSFFGRLSKKYMPDVFKNEHALLISSEIESFGIPGIEAMASGMPVISTSCLGPNEYINEKTGILVPVNDANKLANAIVEMYENYDKYKKEDLVNKAREYSEEVVIPYAIKIYEEAIKNIVNNSIKLYNLK